MRAAVPRPRLRLRRVFLGALVLAALFWGRPGSAEVSLTGALVQGGIVRGQVPPGSSVALDGRELRVSGDGRFVFGLERDHAGGATLALRYPDGRSETRRLTVEKRRYDVQRINGLASELVTPDAAALIRIREEAERINEARQGDIPETWFAARFVWPLRGPITGVYGSQRILNGEPRQPHFGVDVAAPTGTPIVAPADGRVTLAENDLFFTGGTIILDHGHGLSSVFQHLSALRVKVGDEVRQGDVVGAVGATGRVTGAHLHWGMNWFTVRVDPALLVGPMGTE
jgi:murein DD-endopeptidase MepM/ murein hydrolase activator NlpD